MSRTFYVFAFGVLATGAAALLGSTVRQAIGLWLLFQAFGLLADGITDKTMGATARRREVRKLNDERAHMALEVAIAREFAIRKAGTARPE